MGTSDCSSSVFKKYTLDIKSETGLICLDSERERELYSPPYLFVYALEKSIITTVDDVPCRMLNQPLFNNINQHRPITLRRREALTHKPERTKEKIITNKVLYKSNLSIPMFSHLRSAHTQGEINLIMRERIYN